jgi:hypothetical protein
LDILEERGAPELAARSDSGFERSGKGCVDGTVGPSSSQGAALILGFADQAELLRLMELCPEGSSLKILLGPAQSPEDDLPIVSLGLSDVEVFSPGQDFCVDAGSISTVLQGSAGGAGLVVEDLDRYIKCLRPGGEYLIFVDEAFKSLSPCSSVDRCPLSYIGRLAIWVASRSPDCPQDYWWQLVERVHFGPGVITLRLLNPGVKGSSANGGLRLGTGWAGGVIVEMQAELSRVFDLYCGAYEEAEHLRRMARYCRLRLERTELILHSYRELILRIFALIGRVMRASVAILIR